MSISRPFDFRQGDNLNGMTIVSPLVRGGHGDLYLVSEPVEQKKILKVIRKADNECEFTGIEKCRAVSSHIPGLVPVLKVGRLADGRIWCVMPPADNLAQWPDYEPDTLAGRIGRDGRLPPDEVLRLADKMLATVRDLHNAGLAHCDIKPDNIVFVDGEPKLTDYSLLSDTLNRPVDAPFGTVGFVPPEMTGDPDAYEPRACDLYAIGKIVYCAWSGMDAMLFPSVPEEIPLPEIGIMLPIYMKACSGSPNRRFRDAGEFISAVAEARARLHGGKRAWRKRLFLRAGAILLALLPCAAVLVFFLLSAGRGKADPLTVTTPWDVVDPDDGVTSLREAIDFARAPGGPRKIGFNMPESDTVTLHDPALITRNMRFATTNEKSGNPVDIVLDSLRISGRLKTSNEVEAGGGAAFYANTGRFRVKGGRFFGNVDDGVCGSGGAFHLRDAFLTVDDAIFRGNAAFSAGGAMNLERTRVTIHDSQFIGNHVNGFGGALCFRDCPEILIVDTRFEGNGTGDSPYYGWCGGAIILDGSHLVYAVSEGNAVTNEGNESGIGGFIAFSIYDDSPVKSSSAEFRIDGIMIIGDGDGKDSIASNVRTGPSPAPRPVEDISSCDIFIRKTGKGVLSINAPVSDYDGKWFVEDGSLVFTYAKGGDLDGDITISGGCLRADVPYTFRQMILRLENRTDGKPYIINLCNLSGGEVIVDADLAAPGTYPLASGADGFDGTLMLRTGSGEPAAALSPGRALTLGDVRYALDLDGGMLRLTVAPAQK